MSVMNSPTPKNAQNLYVGDEVSFPRMPKRASSSVMKSLFFQSQKSLKLQLLRHSQCGVHAPSTKRFLFRRLPQKRPPKCPAVQKRDWQQLPCMACGDAPSRETLLETIMMSCPERKCILLKSLIVMPNACLHLTRSACVIAIQNACAFNLLESSGSHAWRSKLQHERNALLCMPWPLHTYSSLSHPSTRIFAKIQGLFVVFLKIVFQNF